MQAEGRVGRAGSASKAKQAQRNAQLNAGHESLCSAAGMILGTTLQGHAKSCTGRRPASVSPRRCDEQHSSTASHAQMCMSAMGGGRKRSRCLSRHSCHGACAAWREGSAPHAVQVQSGRHAVQTAAGSRPIGRSRIANNSRCHPRTAARQGRRGSAPYEAGSFWGQLGANDIASRKGSCIQTLTAVDATVVMRRCNAGAMWSLYLSRVS